MLGVAEFGGPVSTPSALASQSDSGQGSTGVSPWLKFLCRHWRTGLVVLLRLLTMQETGAWQSPWQAEACCVPG